MHLKDKKGTFEILIIKIYLLKIVEILLERNRWLMKFIKTQKGMSLVSLIIYLLAVIAVVGIVTRISAFFYKNVDETTEDTISNSEFIKFNTYFTKEINLDKNFVKQVGEGGNYIIFEKSNHQYTFLDNAIYMDNIKICSDIDNCVFSAIDNKNVRVDLIINNKTYVNTYSIT